MMRCATRAAILSAAGALAALPASAADGPCRAAGAAALVGAPLPADAAARTGARTVRALRPGQMATMEFRADRLTIQLDAAGVVVSARCG